MTDGPPAVGAAQPLGGPTTDRPVVLAVDDVVKSYPGPSSRGARTTVLQGVSLHVRSGEVLWVRGGSGSGKSSLLRVAGLLTTADRGTVTVQGTTGAVGRAAAEIRRTTIGFVFQQANLLPDLTVWDNLVIAGRGIATPRLRERLAVWGLAHVADRAAKQISGGEAQRVAFCRALVNDPALLLVDEPTSGLDEDNAATVLAEIRSARARGCAVLVASHDATMGTVADRAVTMRGGRLV